MHGWTARYCVSGCSCADAESSANAGGIGAFLLFYWTVDSGAAAGAAPDFFLRCTSYWFLK